jgi:hypothetical protein
MLAQASGKMPKNIIVMQFHLVVRRDPVAFFEEQKRSVGLDAGPGELKNA